MKKNTIFQENKSRKSKLLKYILVSLLAIISCVIILGPLLYLGFNALFVDYSTLDFSDFVQQNEVVIWVDINNEYTITIDGNDTKYAVFEKTSTGERYILDPHLKSVILYEYDQSTGSKATDSEMLMVFKFAYNEKKENITLKVTEIFDEDLLDIFDINSSDLVEKPLFNAEGYYFMVENTEIVFHKIAE